MISQWTAALDEANRTQKRRLFIAAWKVACLDAFCAFNRLPARAMCAISAWETGWGTSLAATTGNNLWGVSYRDKNRKMRPQRYADLNECRRRIIEVLSLPRYAAARKENNSRAFVTALWAAGYNTETRWRDGIIEIIRQFELLDLP